MARKTHRRKAKSAKRFAIAAALIALISFVVKEVLTDNLRDLHDSLAVAQGQFRVESSQSVTSTEILLQQQIESLQFRTQAGSKPPNGDYSVQIEQAILATHQAQMVLHSDFESVSRLIDNLPSTAHRMRQSRDEMRSQVVGKADQSVVDALKPDSNHGIQRLISIELARVVVLAAMLPVMVLGDSALEGAQRTQDVTEIFIHLCTWGYCILGFSALLLGLYAAVSGIKTEDGVPDSG